MALGAIPNPRMGSLTGGPSASLFNVQLAGWVRDNRYSEWKLRKKHKKALSDVLKNEMLPRFRRLKQKVLKKKGPYNLNHVYTGQYYKGFRMDHDVSSSGVLSARIYNISPTAKYMEYGKKEKVPLSDLHTWLITKVPEAATWENMWAALREIQTEIMTSGIKTAPRFFMQMEEQWKYRGAIDVEYYGLWIARNFNEENAPFLGRGNTNLIF